MLSKKTSVKKHLAKYLVAIPMAAVFMIACTRTENGLPSNLKEKKGEVILRNGHRFEMSPEITEEVQFTYVGGTDTSTAMVTTAAYPVKMDGEVIIRVDDEIIVGKDANTQQPVFKGGNLGEYLVKANQSLFDQLPDGDYDMHLENLILDKNGNLVFNDPVELTSRGNSEASTSLLQTINDKTKQALQNSPGFKPGIVKGYPAVTYYFAAKATPTNILVENHHAVFLPEIDPKIISQYAVEVK